MFNKQDLEIFIITYNRKDKLRNTLNQIFCDASPVKNLDIKIIDNCSDDGTKELCMEYVSRYPNLTLISNNRNIGLSGNIIKPFELASKKWLWVLCDDDDFDWTYWNEIETALSSDENAAVVVERLSSSNNIPLYILINELSFLPAAIYKTEYITSSVMQKMYVNAYTLFPHLALVCDIVNKGKKIFVPEHIIVKQSFNLEKDNKQYARGVDNDLHFRQQGYHLFYGFANSFRMINDKNLRFQCCDNFALGLPFHKAMSLFLTQNGLNINHLFDLFCVFNLRQNIVLLFMIVKYLIDKLISVDITKERIYIVILKKLKIRLKFIRRS